MGTAALWAGWDRWKSGPAAAPAAIGGPPQDVYVELYLAGTWTDISRWVRYADKIKITRGRQSESSTRVEFSKCTMTLNNHDGRFTPRNPTGPYFGSLGRNTPLRVYKIVNGERRYRFYGEVSEWPPKSDISGNDVTVSIEASGITRRLSSNDDVDQSAMRRHYTNPARQNIVAYWPMEDAKDSTQLAGGTATTPPMRVMGTPSLSSYGEWASSKDLPVMASGAFIGKVNMTATGELAVRMFVTVTAAVGAESSLIHLKLAGTAAEWQVGLTAGGDLRTLVLDDDGATLLNNLLVAGMNSRGFAAVSIELTQNGSNIDWVTRVTDFSATDNIDMAPTEVTASGTLASRTFGVVRQVTVGRDYTLTGIAVGHLAVANDTSAFATTNAAMVSHNGERADARMLRLCQEELTTFRIIDRAVIVGNYMTLGDQLVSNFMALLTEAQDTDLGMLTEERDQPGFGYRTRLSLVNQDTTLALSYSAHELSDSLVVLDDDQLTQNDITVSRIGGSSIRQEQTTGTMSTADPEDGGVGRYTDSVSLSMEYDEQAYQQVGFRLRLGTVDEARYPTLSIHLAHPTWADPAMLTAALALDVGDRITLDDLPDWLPPDQVVLLVAGYSEVIDQFEHEITLNCVPGSPWDVAVWNSGDRYDTAGSQLAADATDSATTLSVATTLGPVWTTAAGDLPFDVMVGGERVTVTGVAGASSPQTFTVTRAVNGVVKAQTAGTPLSLADPAYYAL